MSLSDSIARTLRRIRSGKVNTGTKSNNRNLNAKTGAERLAAILDEVDETVLSRRLTFKIGDDTQIVMDAYSRRLMRVISVKPDGLIKKDSSVFIARDDKTIAGQVEEFKTFFTEIAQIDSPIEVTVDPPEVEYSTGEVGFTTQELRDACKDLKFSVAPQVQESKTESVKVATDKPAAEAKVAKKPNGPATTNKKPSTKKITAVKSPTKSKPAPQAKDIKTSAHTQNIFDVCKSHCTNTLLISPEGKLERYSGGTAARGDWQEVASDIPNDIAKWKAATRWMFATVKDAEPGQFIIMKSPRLEFQSVCFVNAGDGTVVGVFNNSELARILSAVTGALKQQGGS